MLRRDFLKLAASTAVLSVQGCLEKNYFTATNVKKPNIVFILADDLGVTDLSFTGSDFYQTPNIDYLASESVYFENAYSSAPTCAPSRAAILTGKYPARIGIVSHGDLRGVTGDGVEMPLKEVTSAEILKSQGYTTCHIGKWHLGTEKNNPKNQGFEYDILSNEFCCPGNFFYPFKSSWLPEEKEKLAAMPDIENYKDGDFLTECLTERAVDFISNHTDKPFFLNLSYYAVHTPIQAREEKIKKYEGLLEPGLKHDNPNYAGLVEHLDDSVGKVLQAIKDAGIEDNTIVIFFSDNGGAVYSDITSNEPYRDGKVTQYEGGIRVPMFVKWPGVTKPGAICNERVIGHDLFPTILSMADINKEKFQKPDIDGRNLTPLLKNPSKNLDRDALHWLRYPMLMHYTKDILRKKAPTGSIIKGDWKLIEFFPTPHGLKHEFELYNLKDDIGETNNLADKMPEKVEELKKAMYRWRKEVNAPVYDGEKFYGNIE